MTLFVCRYAPGRIEDAGMRGVGFVELYAGMKDARNDIVHTGTEAALAGRGLRRWEMLVNDYVVLPISDGVRGAGLEMRRCRGTGRAPGAG